MKVISERYASALLDIALAHGTAEKVKKSLVGFAEIIEESPDLRLFLANPAVARESKRVVLSTLLDRIGAAPNMQNFLSLVVDHRRAALMTEIAEAYTAMLNKKLGIAEAAVTSAKELSATEKKGLVSGLERATGLKISAQYAVDVALLGGARVRIGDVIYDGSVREQLRRLEAELAAE
ncbi:MAG TPA: ATP synthase F1 subunit delta [Candidatus Acidoferrales bacterium]|nr:ATP synthase F1 subunit delta [Candidatus Acidoferrales bacterium]